MRYTAKIARHGISEKDFRIIDLLNSKETTKILPLAEELSLPRTSVSFRLKEMQKRELVKQTKVMNHQEWTLTSHTKELLLDWSQKDKFKANRYLTPENVLQTIKHIINDKSRERLYFIEPYQQTRSFAFGIKTKDKIDIATLFRQKKLISEGVTSEKNFELLETYDTSVLISMEGRMTIVHVVPDEYLKFEEAIFVYKNTVYSIDFDRQSVIEIVSPPLARSMKSVILALRDSGKKIDLNQYIRDVIKKRSK
jgi:DNA-binding Lrp family transcriptional regulator